MRGINWAIRGAMLGGLVLVLSTGPALAAGENIMVKDKAKVEMKKAEKNKDEMAKLEEKNADGKVDVKVDEGILDEDILGAGVLDEILGEAKLGAEE